MSAGLPLLRLPFLPLKIVFDIMQPDELTFLSLCSEKTRNVLTAAKKTFSFNFLKWLQKSELNTLEKMTLLRLKIEGEQPIPEKPITTKFFVSDFVSLNISRDTGEFVNTFSLLVRVECINQKNQYEGTTGSLKIGDITVPVVMPSKHIIVTFWENQSEGIHYLINYSKKIFNSQITDCYVNRRRNQKVSQNLKTAARGLAQHTIDNLFVSYEDGIKFDDYEIILANFKPTTCFVVDGHQIESFQHETNFNSQYLKLDPANWFTIGNLLTTDCEDINLYETNLTNEDMKEYLRQWMAARFPKLKALTVELRENVDLEYILSGLPDFLQRDNNEKHEYEIVRDEDYGTISIKRHDKPTARISIPSVSFERKFVLHII